MHTTRQFRNSFVCMYAKVKKKNQLFATLFFLYHFLLFSFLSFCSFPFFSFRTKYGGGGGDVIRGSEFIPSVGIRHNPGLLQNNY
jgi:hypothetical protein